ncbi:hypothetical protein PUN28_014351 [Cardiocondyla obscurior]|uniref:Uncharacterized protein n=1 Tax=Cardiocondyla obscurior TaxID=286306 RepID=A0AAW2F3K3_9HYME
MGILSCVQKRTPPSLLPLAGRQKLSFLYGGRNLYGASLCGVTYCLGRGLLPDSSPETSSVLMNDGKTLFDLKHFPIVRTRNGWNVFATRSHSPGFEALGTLRDRSMRREKLRENEDKNSRVGTMENRDATK